MDLKGLNGQVFQFTCIVCPFGCRLKVETRNGKIASIEGNRCPRGLVHAQNEIKPKRTLITVIKVIGGDWPVVSVKTLEPIPKELIPKVMDALSKVVVQAPVKVGEKIVEELSGLKITIVATRTINCSRSIRKNHQLQPIH